MTFRALVFDAYGFAPQAAVDGTALAQAMQEGASDAELQDLTETMMMTRCVSDAADERRRCRDGERGEQRSGEVPRHARPLFVSASTAGPKRTMKMEGKMSPTSTYIA